MRSNSKLLLTLLVTILLSGLVSAGAIGTLCSCGKVTGTCIDVSDINNCFIKHNKNGGGTIVSGLCPGGKDIRCCLPYYNGDELSC